jgi:hypothetical protein
MRARLLLRRWTTHLLIGTVAATAFAVTLSFSAPKQAAAVCAPTLAQPRQIVQRDGETKLRVIVTNAMDGLKGMPAEAASSVGRNDDESPEWTDNDDPDGRYYWYESSAWLLWQPSVPCTGDDKYWAVMEVTCRRHGPAGNVDTPCYFDDMYLALHRGDLLSGIWVNPWGYHKYVRSNDTACEATNTGHTIPDYKLARSKIIIQMWFRNPFNESELLHHTEPREMTSHPANQNGQVGGGQDLSAGTIPSYTAGPSIC